MLVCVLLICAFNARDLPMFSQLTGPFNHTAHILNKKSKEYA